MPDSRTVLPTPNLLNLISIRAGANAITLAARSSSRVARCPVCAKQSLKGHSQMLWASAAKLRSLMPIMASCASCGERLEQQCYRHHGPRAQGLHAEGRVFQQADPFQALR
jgi:hypothetical protein